MCSLTLAVCVYLGASNTIWAGAAGVGPELANSEKVAEWQAEWCQTPTILVNLHAGSFVPYG
jgi:hypothetical protein